jgi:L-2,4-diaminobutyrate transaminase
MAAAIARREIAEKLPIFFDLHTYGGHPVSAAAALTNIRIIEREDLVRNAADVGGHMLRLLEELRVHPIVGDVRGIGLLMAVELMRDPARHEDFAPDAGVDHQVAAVARELGVFVRPLGGTVLLGPPLIFTKAQAERTVEVLDTAIGRVEARLGLGAAAAGRAGQPEAEVAR